MKIGKCPLCKVLSKSFSGENENCHLVYYNEQYPDIKCNQNR